MTKEEKLENRVQKLENRLELLENAIRLINVKIYEPHEPPIYGPKSNIHRDEYEDSFGSKLTKGWEK